MKISLIAAAILITAISLISLAYAISKTNESLKNYKRQNSILLTSYTKLKQEYDSLFEQTKNLRQVTILSSSQHSANFKISEIIDAAVKKVDGEVSVYFKNLTTSESIIVNGDKKYYMASMYKVILTIFLLDEVAKGNTTLNTHVGTSGATLTSALQKIITESNNEYAQILAESYGWITIEQAVSEKLGISFSFDKDLTTTVKDIGVLFEDIALSLRVEDSESKYLLNLLQDQTKLSKLPKYLPKNILSHNKTGEYKEYSHDAGIFYTPKANYVLAFMSKTKNQGETNEQMAKMSKEIYETLNN
ncbi:MAG: serine hydrolase [Candidatus Levybacteria bacterium]|nr:serine hydrolase [Candidatus Levybacteria bacterium]